MHLFTFPILGSRLVLTDVIQKIGTQHISKDCLLLNNTKRGKWKCSIQETKEGKGDYYLCLYHHQEAFRTSCVKEEIYPFETENGCIYCLDLIKMPRRKIDVEYMDKKWFYEMNQDSVRVLTTCGVKHEDILGFSHVTNTGEGIYLVKTYRDQAGQIVGIHLSLSCLENEKLT